MSNHQDIFYKDPKIPYIECRRTVQSNKCYKEHLHNTVSIGAIDKGRVLLKTGKDNTILESGSIIIIPQLMLHSCNPLNDQPRSYYMLYVDVEKIFEIEKEMFHVEKMITLPLKLIKEISIYKKYIHMFNTFTSNTFLFEKEEIVLEFLEKIVVNSIKLDKDEKHRPSNKIKKAKEILSSNLETELTLEELAKAVDKNPFSLIRSFKKEYGVTPFSFRLNLRIERAKKLLKKGANISYVSQECGFYDQSHFVKYFKDIVLVSPKEYAKNFI